MARKQTGGSWESLGRGWADSSRAPAVKVTASEAVDVPAQVIYGPRGEVLSRLVDRDIQMGFRADKT